LAVFSHYDESLNSPAQALSSEALAFIREDLAHRPGGALVVVATHLCLEALTNRDQLIDAFGHANVVLVLTGHYHKAQVAQYRGRNFLQLPSPSPNGEREIMVIRFKAGRLLALPFNYERRQWVTEPRKVLEVPLPPPSPK
jgi:hypothetical protein